MPQVLGSPTPLRQPLRSFDPTSFGIVGSHITRTSIPKALGSSISLLLNAPIPEHVGLNSSTAGSVVGLHVAAATAAADATAGSINSSSNSSSRSSSSPGDFASQRGIPVGAAALELDPRLYPRIWEGIQMPVNSALLAVRLAAAAAAAAVEAAVAEGAAILAARSLFRFEPPLHHSSLVTCGRLALYAGFSVSVSSSHFEGSSTKGAGAPNRGPEGLGWRGLPPGGALGTAQAPQQQQPQQQQQHCTFWSIGTPTGVTPAAGAAATTAAGGTFPGGPPFGYVVGPPCQTSPQQEGASGAGCRGNLAQTLGAPPLPWQPSVQLGPPPLPEPIGGCPPGVPSSSDSRGPPLNPVGVWLPTDSSGRAPCGGPPAPPVCAGPPQAPAPCGAPPLYGMSPPSRSLQLPQIPPPLPFSSVVMGAPAGPLGAPPLPVASRPSVPHVGPSSVVQQHQQQLLQQQQPLVQQQELAAAAAITATMTATGWPCWVRPETAKAVSVALRLHMAAVVTEVYRQPQCRLGECCSPQMHQAKLRCSSRSNSSSSSSRSSTGNSPTSSSSTAPSNGSPHEDEWACSSTTASYRRDWSEALVKVETDVQQQEVAAAAAEEALHIAAIKEGPLELLGSYVSVLQQFLSLEPRRLRELDSDCLLSVRAQLGPLLQQQKHQEQQQQRELQQPLTAAVPPSLSVTATTAGYGASCCSMLPQLSSAAAAAAGGGARGGAAAATAAAAMAARGSFPRGKPHISGLQEWRPASAHLTTPCSGSSGAPFEYVGSPAAAAACAATAAAPAAGEGASCERDAGEAEGGVTSLRPLGEATPAPAAGATATAAAAAAAPMSGSMLLGVAELGSSPAPCYSQGHPPLPALREGPLAVPWGEETTRMGFQSPPMGGLVPVGTCCPPSGAATAAAAPHPAWWPVSSSVTTAAPNPVEAAAAATPTAPGASGKKKAALADLGFAVPAEALGGGRSPRGNVQVSYSQAYQAWVVVCFAGAAESRAFSIRDLGPEKAKRVALLYAAQCRRHLNSKRAAAAKLSAAAEGAAPAAAGSPLPRFKSQKDAKDLATSTLMLFGSSGPPGGSLNLVGSSGTIPYTSRSDVSVSRVERLSKRAMELPYVHGVRFEAETFSWVAEMRGEARRFLVKKHGFAKSRLCAVQRILSWRASLPEAALALELKVEQQVVQLLQATSRVPSPLSPPAAMTGAPPPPVACQQLTLPVAGAPNPPCL
ncbi:hypothetical protein Esti_002112 [Eimeria stiedai]